MKIDPKVSNTIMDVHYVLTVGLARKMKHVDIAQTYCHIGRNMQH